MLKSLRIPIALAVLAFALLASASIPQPQPAQADHDDSVYTPIPVAWRGYKASRAGGPPMATGIDPKTGVGKGVPAVARNLVTGNALKICAENTDLEKHVKKAISAWNTGAGHTILEYAGLESTGNCPAGSNATGGYSSILVRVATNVRNCGGSPGGTWRACAKPGMVFGDPTFDFGRYGYVYLNTANSLVNPGDPNDADGRKVTSTIAHEIGHLLGFAHIYQWLVPIVVFNPATNMEEQSWWQIDGCPGSGNMRYNKRVWNATYGRYVSGGSAPTPNAIPGISTALAGILTEAQDVKYGGALMLPTNRCKGDRAITSDPNTRCGSINDTDGQWCYSRDVALNAYDKLAYTKLFSPSSVDDVEVKDSPTTSGHVRVEWDPSDVHVEKQFHVQVKVTYEAPLSGTGWVKVATVGANGSHAEFDQPDSTTAYTVVTRSSTTTTKGSYGTYRVVSVTDALGDAAPDAGAISAEVDHERPLFPPPPPVCVAWGYYLAWVSADGTTGSIRPTGFTSLASARANLASAKFFLGGTITPGMAVTITEAYTFCSEYSVAGASADSADSGGARAESESSPDTRADAALDELRTCLGSATTGLEVNACMETFEDQLEGD